ncbi:MAG: hypothetical protein KJ601_03110 [Nanoarchaeota archaeon]|nr:hypothetical protein [Nanoarchaeota archaeon]
MDILVAENLVNGKKIRCILSFDKYNERKYKKDFQDFVDYQTKKGFTGQVGERFRQLYRLENYPYIPYATFRKTTLDLFSRVIFYMVKQDPTIAQSDELNIQIKFIRVPKWSYSFETDDKGFDPENACYHAAGTWFIQYIVAPYVYLGKIEFSVVTRYFWHELTHYIDIIKKYLLWDDKYDKKIRKLSRKRSSYCLNYLYNCMFNLREEGLAEFNSRKGSDSINIDMKGIREFNRNMELLTHLRLKKQAEEFYQYKIGWENLTPSGEYAVGRTMCFTVALAVAKRLKKQYKLTVDHQHFYGYDHNLDIWMTKGNTLTISEMPVQCMDDARELILTKPHYYFLKLYEQSCNVLGISEGNRAMTSRMFYDLTRQAMVNAKKDKIKRLKRRGYAIIESEEQVAA